MGGDAGPMMNQNQSLKNGKPLSLNQSFIASLAIHAAAPSALSLKRYYVASGTTK
jgi:hypothetical protein